MPIYLHKPTPHSAFCILLSCPVLCRHEHNEPLTVSAAANMLSTILYYRRFFPYYVMALVCGLDADGHGALFSYDPVGSYAREAFRATGTSGGILQPVLDGLLGLKNRADLVQPFAVDVRGDTEKQPPVWTTLSKTEALRVAHDAFVAAAERDINCGDACVFRVLSAAGLESFEYPLRKD